MKIGELTIDRDSPMRICAELGTLHHHQGINGLMLATRDAFNSGADMVKVQLIDPQTAWWANRWQKNRYTRLIKSFPKDQWRGFLKDANKEFKRPVFASVFDTPTLRLVQDAMPAVKVAWLARRKADLISACIKSLPTIISLGDDKHSISMLQNRQFNSENTKILYVQSKYPLSDHECRIPVFGEIYNGLSIHSRNYRVFASSIMMGAELLEVHCQSTGANGFDTGYALTMEQLARLVSVRDSLSSFLLPSIVGELDSYQYPVDKS